MCVCVCVCVCLCVSVFVFVCLCVCIVVSVTLSLSALQLNGTSRQRTHRPLNQHWSSVWRDVVRLSRGFINRFRGVTHWFRGTRISGYLGYVHDSGRAASMVGLRTLSLRRGHTEFQNSSGALRILFTSVCTANGLPEKLWCYRTESSRPTRLCSSCFTVWFTGKKGFVLFEL